MRRFQFTEEAKNDGRRGRNGAGNVKIQASSDMLSSVRNSAHLLMLADNESESRYG
jgi:hypothetical protein